jgi:MFS family permease
MLTFSGINAVWPIFAMLVLHGSARAFMMPATQAILINLVSQDNFGRAVALSSSTFHVAVIAGPLLGGMLYLAGAKVVYAIVAGLLLLVVLLMAMTRTLTRQSGGREPVSWQSLLEGLRFVWSRPVVMEAISLDLFAVLFQRRYRIAAGAGARCAASRPDRAWHAAHVARRGRHGQRVCAASACAAGAARDAGQHSRPCQRGQFGFHRRLQ